MQALTLALLLALSATAEEAGERLAPGVAGQRVRQVAPQLPPTPDPCAAAREIARQPPCPAGGDCQALRLWQRSFGSPRIEPLDPTRAAFRSRRLRRGAQDSPDPPRPSAPGFVCPAGQPR